MTSTPFFAFFAYPLAFFGTLVLVHTPFVAGLTHKAVEQNNHAQNPPVFNAKALANASNVVTFPMPSVPTLEDFQRQADVLHYLRIPKTASTSLRWMVEQLQVPEHGPKRCRNLDMGLFHNVLARDLAPESKNFVVLRDPITRFVSQWGHLKAKLWACQGGTDAVVNEQFLNVTLDTPITWGNTLLHDPRSRAAFLTREPLNFHMDCMVAMVAWKQSEYVNERTQFACMPALRRDTQRILDQDQNITDCQLPKEERVLDGNDRKDKLGDFHAWDKDQTVQTLARKLYPEDFQLWKKHCER